MAEEEPGWFSKLLATVWGYLKKFLLGPGGALIVVIVAILLAMVGVKNFQVGGLLGKLLGKKPKDKAIDKANSVSEDRVDANGKVIPKGVPDSKGITQAIVVPIKEPGIFSDPKTVKFVPPGEKKAVEVELPDGVSNKDVEKVVVVKPKVYAVTVKDTSGIEAKTVDDLLAKYGG